MTFFECCEAVRGHGLQMICPSKNAPGQYDLAEPFDGGTGWVWLDTVTANVVCQVHDALSPEHREKFKALPAGVILKFCWQVAGGT